jgi:hypothetical protein
MTDPADLFAELFTAQLISQSADLQPATPEPTPGPRAPAPNYAQGGSGRGSPPAPDPAYAFTESIRTFAQHRSPTGMWHDLFDRYHTH